MLDVAAKLAVGDAQRNARPQLKAAQIARAGNDGNPQGPFALTEGTEVLLEGLNAEQPAVRAGRAALDFHLCATQGIQELEARSLYVDRQMERAQTLAERGNGIEPDARDAAAAKV